eukprot:4168231-Amphidinium_carterae.1
MAVRDYLCELPEVGSRVKKRAASETITWGIRELPHRSTRHEDPPSCLHTVCRSCHKHVVVEFWHAANVVIPPLEHSWIDDVVHVGLSLLCLKEDAQRHALEQD